MASNLGPLAAVKGRISRNHQGLEAELSETQALLETSAGFLYVVDFASKSAAQRALSQNTVRWTYLAEILREDAQIYFAFTSLYERDLFSALMLVKDVGPKTAALIVAELGAENILRLMQQGVWKGLKIAGVGPKTWESIVFGLNKKKKALLPLLTKVQGVPVESKSSTVEKLSSNESFDFDSSTTASGADSNMAWTPTRYPSDSIITMFEGLGLNTTQTNVLFADCLKEIENFQELPDTQKVPHMLKLHGRHRSVGLGK